MAIANETYRRLALCGLAALSVTACATGQGSFMAGSGGSGGGEDARLEDAPLDDAAPGVVAASGNALLPGVRAAAPAASPGPSLLAANPSVGLVGGGLAAHLSTGPAAADLNASANLLGGAAAAKVGAGLSTALGSAQVGANLGGPLLALNGSRSALLGVGVAGPSVLGATPNLTVNVGAALNPATAATQTLISASVSASQTAPTPSTPSSPLPPPMLPPVLTVPGATPLQSLLPLLTTTRPPLPLLGR